MPVEFYARLPLHGETQFIPGDNRNRGDWNRSPALSTGALSSFAIEDDFRYIDYLGQIARAAEINRFKGALLVNAPFGDEPWINAALLARETRRLEFVVAFHAYHLSPWQAAQQAASFQRGSGGRLVWNLIHGGSDAVQHALGDTLAHDERYARGIEFLDVVKGFWANESFHYKGKYYQANGLGLRGPLARAPLPVICSAGTSAKAKELAARHADYYLLLAEDPAVVAGHIADVRTLAREYGREGAIRFGLSVDAIARETEEDAHREARRFFEEGVAAGTVKAARERSAQVSDTNRARFERYNGREVRGFEDLFVAPGLWGGFGYIGIPPGFAFVGSYVTVADRIRDFAALGIEKFFINGYPHLEEIYRLGEHVLPLLRDAPAHLQPANDEQGLPLVIGPGLEARGN